MTVKIPDKAGGFNNLLGILELVFSAVSTIIHLELPLPPPCTGGRV